MKGTLVTLEVDSGALATNPLGDPSRRPVHVYVPPGGARGSRWEDAILELAEAGEPRFVKILAEHVARGVIVSPRASAALEPGNAAA